MLTSALFITGKIEIPKSPALGEEVKSWFVFMIEYYAAVKMVF